MYTLQKWLNSFLFWTHKLYWNSIEIIYFVENKDNETRNTRAVKQAQSKDGESDARIAEIAILTGATDETGKPSLQSTQPSKSEQEHLIKLYAKENGLWLDEKSIPLRKEDFALIPNIIAAQDLITKGAVKPDGTESIRYIKNLRNGIVVVVGQEGRFDVSNMENITMWAENKKSLVNVADDFHQKSPAFNVQNVIIEQSYIAKLHQDVENTIKIKMIIVFSLIIKARTYPRNWWSVSLF